MKHLLTVLLATAMVVLPVRADEALQLRNIDTTVLANRLKAHPELEKVVVFASNTAVTLMGNDEQVADAMSAIALMDVPAIQYSVKMQVVRCKVDADGKVTERVTSAPLISTLDGLQGKIGMQTQTVALTPTSNPDGTVTVAVEFRQAEDSGGMGRWAENERRMAIGAKERLLGLTDSPDKTLRKAVREGKVVRERGAYTADYLDITVVRIDSTTGLTQ